MIPTRTSEGPEAEGAERLIGNHQLIKGQARVKTQLDFQIEGLGPLTSSYSTHPMVLECVCVCVFVSVCARVRVCVRACVCLRVRAC